MNDRRAPDPPAPRSAEQRPVAVTLLVVLLLAKAAIAAGLALGWTLDGGRFATTLGLPSVLTNAGNSVAVTVALAVVAALLLVAAIGVYAGRRLGWLLTKVITGAFLAGDLVTFGAGTGQHVWMLLNIVTVFYLNQRDVRERFMPPATDARAVGASA